MQLIADLHTHTVLSGHAFSTVRENAMAGARAGLLMLANTDHGPAMRGATKAIYSFINQNILPECIEGVRVLRGAEVNITGDGAEMDLAPLVLGKLELVIGSLHDVTIEQADAKTNTDRLVAAVESGLIDVVGHPGNPYFPLEKERLVRACRGHEVAIEVNNSSLAGTVRPGSRKNMVEFLKLCMDEKVMVSVGSDAHWMDLVGRLTAAVDLIEECGVPEELIIPSEEGRLLEFLAMRKERRQAAVKALP